MFFLRHFLAAIKLWHSMPDIPIPLNCTSGQANLLLSINKAI